MNPEIEDDEVKTALVVGSSKGIGKAICRELRMAGCHVIGVSRSAVPVLGSEVMFPYQFDVSNPKHVALLADTIIRDQGVPDIVVYVVGGSGGIRDHNLASTDWQKVWYLNLGYAIDLNRVFLPLMEKRGWGRVVHFSSNGVKLSTGRAPYTSAKAALEGYVKVMGREYAKTGVVISAVAPGPIDTPGLFMYSQSEEWTKAFWEKYVPAGRWGKPEEVAGVVAMLCSQHASYMSGAIVDVDGGMR